MPWEHQLCGTVHEGAVPPENCDYCSRVLVRVTKFAGRGWRRVTAEGKTYIVPTARQIAQRRAQQRPGTVGKRQAIYERDDYTCQGPCGRRLPPEHPDHRELTLDHRIPRSRGGSNRSDNLQTMCGPCNVAKGDKMPEEIAA